MKKTYKYIIEIPVTVKICVDADDKDKALIAANREVYSKLQGCSASVATGEIIAVL